MMARTEPGATGIVMNGREWFCPDVNRARCRLTELSLAWTEYNVESDAEAANRMRELTGRGNVPTLLIGDAVLVEPSRDEIDEALKHAGLMPARV